MPATPIYHIGIACNDIEQTKRKYTELLGLTWQRNQIIDDWQLTYRGETITLNSVVVYSVEGPPFIELLQLQDGFGPHGRVEFAEGLHHLGVWSDGEVSGTVSALERRGFPASLAFDEDVPDVGKIEGAFLDTRLTDGTIIELVGRYPHMTGYTDELPGARDER